MRSCAVHAQAARTDAGVQAVPPHLVSSKGAKGVARPRFVNQTAYSLSHLLGGYLPNVEEVV